MNISIESMKYDNHRVPAIKGGCIPRLCVIDTHLPLFESDINLEYSYTIDVIVLIIIKYLNDG